MVQDLRCGTGERLGDLEQAEATFRAAESLDPLWPLTIMSVARYASDRGDAGRWGRRRARTGAARRWRAGRHAGVVRARDHPGHGADSGTPRAATSCTSTPTARPASSACWPRFARWTRRWRCCARPANPPATSEPSGGAVRRCRRIARAVTDRPSTNTAKPKTRSNHCARLRIGRTATTEAINAYPLAHGARIPFCGALVGDRPKASLLFGRYPDFRRAGVSDGEESDRDIGRRFRQQVRSRRNGGVLPRRGELRDRFGVEECRKIARRHEVVGRCRPTGGGPTPKQVSARRRRSESDRSHTKRGYPGVGSPQRI
jgi:hypothetical protein